MKERGFTLLELLIAMAITIFVMAAGYSFFTNSFNFSVVHSRKTGMQRETRVAIDILSREVRIAGFGLLDPLTGESHATTAGLSSITPSNNADADPEGVASRLDRITLWGGYQFVGTLTCETPPCTNPVAAEGAAEIWVTPLAGTNPTSPTINGGTITLDGFYTGVVNAVTDEANGSYRLGLATPLNRDYTSSNSVMLLQQVAYRVQMNGTEPALFRTVNGGAAQLIASGVEDLQFAYLMNNGTIVDNPAGAATLIRAVRISMLARQQDTSATATISARPALEDHAAGTAADRYHRRWVTKVVEVRNHGVLY
ncbi:MAG: PilW family protein [Candidatus Manganitrophus sp. SB1]|nr:PilW family protein [Candidatus Manganitrophus morganii]